MLPQGTARKVTIYINEDAKHHMAPLYEAILMFLMHKGVAGATATRALAGFGAHQVMHTPRIEALAEHLPIRIEFIESADKVESLLPALYDMVNDGVIEMQDTQVIRASPREKPREATPPRHETIRERAQMMRIYMGESDRWEGEPLYEALVERLRLMDVAGATVYRGILGYGAEGRTHKSGRLPFSHDLPIMISVVDTEDKLKDALTRIEPMLQDALIVLSDVDMIRLVHTAARAGSRE